MKKLLIIMIIVLHTTLGFTAEKVFTYTNTKSPKHAATFKGEEYETIFHRYHFTTADTLLPILTKQLPYIKISADSRTKVLIMQGKQKHLNKAKEIINKIDTPPVQISLETKIIEVSESGLQQIGVLWDITQEGIRFGKSTRTDIEGLLKTLESTGQAKILATPKITAIEKEEAFIRIGDRIPYAIPVGNNSLDNRWSIQYLNAGILLNINTTITASNNISLNLHPQVINLKEWRPTPAGDFPILSSREAQTKINVENGKSIVIAGLRNEEEKENITKVPLLGYIPWLGELFTYRSKEKITTEVVFVVTPKII